MHAMTIKKASDEIPGGGDAGDPFIVGDELTIFEAAMVYCGRHPCGRFIEGASLRVHESFVGRSVLPQRNFDERPHKTSWAVWRDLCERVDRGEIEPVRKYYSSDGKLDPLTTVIRTVDLANLAKKRGDSNLDFSSWMPAEGSEKVRFPAGRKPKADWDALEEALKLRIDEIGFPIPDHDDKNWRRKVDVIGWAQDFLEDRKEQAATTTVAGHIDKMLARLKLRNQRTEI
jgi:hypothetical protein